MTKAERVVTFTAIVAVELALVYINVILFIGFVFMNNVETPVLGRVALLIACICEPIAFIAFWYRPKPAAVALGLIAAITLALSLIAADSRGFQNLWLSGGILWTFKGIFAYLLWDKGSTVLTSRT